MARVKVKHPRPREPENRTKLLETLSKHQIFATKIIPLEDSLIVLTSDTIEAEKIFGSACIAELRSHNFTPLLPPEIKASRTIIVTRLDDYIYKNSEEEITEKNLNKTIAGLRMESQKYTSSQNQIPSK